MGATVRKVFFWSHLAVGLAAAVMILIMCVTGVLMTYERQIRRAKGIDAEHQTVMIDSRGTPPRQ